MVEFEDFIRERERRQESLADIANPKRRECHPFINFFVEIYGGFCRCIGSRGEGWHW